VLYGDLCPIASHGAAAPTMKGDAQQHSDIARFTDFLRQYIAAWLA